jgi:hypothetical protein
VFIPFICGSNNVMWLMGNGMKSRQHPPLISGGGLVIGSKRDTLQLPGLVALGVRKITNFRRLQIAV